MPSSVTYELYQAYKHWRKSKGPCDPDIAENLSDLAYMARQEEEHMDELDARAECQDEEPYEVRNGPRESW